MFLFILEFYIFEFCVSLFLAESNYLMMKYTLGPIQDTLYLFLEKKFSRNFLENLAETKHH